MGLGEDAAPDWPYWGLLPTVTLWEAVALSLNLDPREFEPHPAGGRPAGIAIVCIPPPEFYRRLNLARRCIGETLPAAKPRYGEEHVRLPSFTKWATGLGWSVPPELHDMAADNGPSPPEPAVVEASPQPIRGKKAKLPIADYGSKIAALLAERERQASGEPAVDAGPASADVTADGARRWGQAQNTRGKTRPKTRFRAHQR
jgi:hypothetical protein